MPSVAPPATISNTPGKRPNSGCSVHSQRQCCMANPQFQSYIATYSSKSCSDTTATTTMATTQPTTTPSDTGDNQASVKDFKSILVHQRSASFSSSLVNHTNSNRNQKPYVDLSPHRSPSTTSSSSTLVSAKARRRTSAPPTNRSRRSSITIISDPPVPVPSLPPVFRNSNLNLVSSTSSPLSTPTKTQTFQTQSPLDFLVDENAARRSITVPEITPSTPTPSNSNQTPITNRNLNNSGTIKRNESSSVTTNAVPTSDSHTTANINFDRVNICASSSSPSPSLSQSPSPSPSPFKPRGHLIEDRRITKTKFLESTTSTASGTGTGTGTGTETINNSTGIKFESESSSSSSDAGRMKTSITKSNTSSLKATISSPIQSTVTLTGTTTTILDQDKVKFAPTITAITSGPIINTTTATTSSTLSIPITSSNSTSITTLTDSKKPLPAPTNHVHLSRKTYSTRTSLFSRIFSSGTKDKNRLGRGGNGRKGTGVGICDIKGTFVIDPTLVVPSGLFRSSFLASPVGSNEDGDRGIECTTGDDCSRDGVGDVERGRTRRISYGTTGRGGGGGMGGTTELLKSKRELGQLGKKKNLKLEVENGGIDVDVYLVPSKSNEVVSKTEPTTLELALLPQLSKNKANTQSLVTRIHAPIPRPPFQLSARTYTPISNTITPPLQSTPNPPSALKSNKNLLKEKEKVRFDLNHPATSTSSININAKHVSLSPSPVPIELDTGSIELHLPRTFHGPITIHVASGNLDDHISLSKEVEEKCVVLREDEFTRGVFLGSTFDVNNLVSSTSLVLDQGEGGMKAGCEGLDERGNDKGKAEGNENGRCIRCSRIININNLDNPNFTQTSFTECEGNIRTIQDDSLIDGNGNGNVRYVFPSYATNTNGTRPTSLSLTSSPHTPTQLSTNNTNTTPTGTTMTVASTMTATTTTNPSSPVLPPTPTKNKIKRKPVKFIDYIDSPLSSSNSGTDSSDIQHRENGNFNFVIGNRKNFLDMDDVDPETPTPPQAQSQANSNIKRIGVKGQLGWKLTRTQGLNGRLRVLSEHQPTSSTNSPTASRISSPIPIPIPTPILTPTTMSITSTRNVDEDDEGKLRVRRISIEKKRFVPDGVGWRDVEDTTASGSGNNSDSTIGECCCQVPHINMSHTHATLDMSTSAVVVEGQGKAGRKKEESESEEREKEKEWKGDRVDISIGTGRVWIQYEDSKETSVVKDGWFGFWGRMKG